MFNPALNIKIRDIAKTVYDHLGPGLPGIVYKESFIHELNKTEIFYLEDPEIPIDYKGEILESGLPASFIIDMEIVIYIKRTTKDPEYDVSRVYKFMQFSGIRCGMLLDFNRYEFSEVMRVFMTLDSEFC